jgi:hypothetical protein
LSRYFVNGTTHAIVDGDRRFGNAANADEEVTELLKPVLKKRLFAPNKAVAPLEDLLPFVAGHLACMNHAECRETLRLRAFGR